MMKNPVPYALLAMLATFVHGETITVCQDGSCDHTSIHSALDAAEDGDTILVGPGTYTGQHTLYGYQGGASHVILKSSNGPEQTIIDGQNTGSVLAMQWGDEYASGIDITIDGFTFRNGVGTCRGAAICCRADQYEEHAALKIMNCTFEDCSLGTTKGANDALVFQLYFDEFEVTKCVFRQGNHQWLYLGGSWSNTFTVKNCSFEENTGDSLVSQGCLEDCVFNGNNVGTIAADNWEITGCTFEDNIVEQGCVARTLGFVRNCTFERNTSSVSSAAIYAKDAPLIQNCTFKDNVGIYGGAISNHYSSNTSLALEVVGCTFENNSATFGGAVWAQASISVYDSNGCGNIPTNFYGPVTDAGGNDFADSCCPADLNGDRQVNGGDLATVLSNWGGNFTPADLDEDGQIGGSDLAIVLSLWGPCGK